MSKAKKTSIVVTLLLLLITGTLFGIDRYHTNNSAPDIQMQTASGDIIDLRQRNAPTLVVFWATTCASCLKEQPALVKLYRELKDQGLSIIGVSMYYDPPIQVDKLVKQRNIPYPVVMDVQKKVATAFRLKPMVTPTTILIAPDNRIVLRKSGVLDMTALRKQVVDLLNNN